VGQDEGFGFKMSHAQSETLGIGPWARRVVLFVLAFEALGSFIGGPMLIAAPDGGLMHIPVEEMHGLFPHFLVPGMLLTALGVLNGVAFFVLLRWRPSAWLWVGLALGGFLVWFAVELSVMGAKSWAQAVWGIPVPVGIIAGWPLVAARLRRRQG
jgi:hypothetical protein